MGSVGILSSRFFPKSIFGQSSSTHIVSCIVSPAYDRGISVVAISTVADPMSHDGCCRKPTGKFLALRQVNTPTNDNEI